MYYWYWTMFNLDIYALITLIEFSGCNAMFFLDLFAIINLLVVAGFQPLTIGLWGECSTNVLLTLDNVFLDVLHHFLSAGAHRIWTLDHRIMRQVFYQCDTDNRHLEPLTIGSCSHEASVLPMGYWHQTMFCIDIFAIITLLAVAGFEPLTIGLWGEFSTNVLLALDNVLLGLFAPFSLCWC